MYAHLLCCRTETRPANLHPLPNFGAGKRVPFQSLPHSKETDRNCSCAVPHRTSDQNLVPESSHEVEERKQVQTWWRRWPRWLAAGVPIAIRGPRLPALYGRLRVGIHPRPLGGPSALGALQLNCSNKVCRIQKPTAQSYSVYKLSSCNFNQVSSCSSNKKPSLFKNSPPIPSYIHTQSPELALICCEISGAMSSSRVKKFQEIQKIMPQRQVSMNEIRIDKLAFTFKKNNMSHYYILLYNIFQEARRRIKTTALLLKAVCKQQLQEEKNVEFSFWSISGFKSRVYNCCDTAAEIYWFDIIYCMKKNVHQKSDWR